MFDVYRNEVFATMKEDKVQGIKNMVALTSALVTANATADVIKDAIVGRETDIKDLALDQMFTLIGFSRYSVFQAQREGLGRTVAEQIVPATKLIDNVSKDIFKSFDKSLEINEIRSIRSLPLAGELYYWWFGKGVTTKQKSSDTGIGIPTIEIPSIDIPSIEIPEISI